MDKLPVKNLPTIGEIYLRVFTLYKKVFIPILPFVIAYAVTVYFFQKALPDPDIEQVEINLKFVLLFAAEMVIFILFYNWMMYAAYKKHNNEALSYSDVILKGLTKFFPVLLTYLVMLFPFIIFLIPLSFFSAQVTPTFQWVDVVTLVFLVLALIALLYIIYFVVAPLRVVAKDAGPLMALKQSWRLIKGHWWKTLLVYSILSALSMLFTLALAYLMPEFASPIMILLFTPLWISLLVIYNQALETTYEEKR